MFDARRSFQNRKEIYRLVAASQAKESAALKQMGEIATRTKGEILLVLSNWLLGLKQGEVNADSLQRDWAEVLEKFSFQEWLKLQEEARQLEVEMRSARAGEQGAGAAYRREAPLGFVTEWFADPAAKRKIQKLQAAAAEATEKREQVENQLNANVRRRQRMGKQFLSTCIHSLDKLCAVKTLGPRVKQSADKMAKELDTAWAAYLQVEMPAQARLSALIEELRGGYNAPRLADGRFSLRAAPVEQ